MPFLNVDLASLKAYLGLDPLVTTDDVYLQMQLDAGIETMQRVLGRTLYHGNYQETIYKVSDMINLTEYPVRQIISISDIGSAVPDDQYTINKLKGRIVFNNRGYYRRRYCFADVPNIIIEYEAGYDNLPAAYLIPLYDSIGAILNTRDQTDEFGAAVKRVTTYDVGSVDLAVSSNGSAATADDVFTQNFSSFLVASTFGNLDQDSVLLELLDENGDPIP